MNATKKSKRNNKLFVAANTAWDKGDLQRAFELFLQAAEAGDLSSQLDLGYFFDCGLHVRKDKKKAMQWYYRAFRQGDAGAANNIATVHRDNRHVGRMLWWFRKAVSMGDHDALLEVGRCYEEGCAVTKNLKKAEFCYRRVLLSQFVTEFSKEEATKRLARLEKRARRLV